MKKAAIGFRAKTGRAIAVVLIGTRKTPEFLWRGEVSLIDPAMDNSQGPYHHVMELPWSEALLAIKPAVNAIEVVAARAVLQLIEDMHARGADLRAAGVVGSPQRPLARIGNEHIRAHAAEGILYRRVLERAASENRVRCTGWSEKELAAAAPDEAAMQRTMKELGRAAGPPWRADERLAATAAWIALR